MLRALEQDDAADKERQEAMSSKNELMEEFPEFLTEDPENEAAVFDQILPIWIIQMSGKLQDGGRNRESREH